MRGISLGEHSHCVLKTKPIHSLSTTLTLVMTIYDGNDVPFVGNQWNKYTSLLLRMNQDV